jgi:cation-transporting ATPase 13A2
MQLLKYGKSNIEVPMKSTMAILTDEVLNPFYIFQIFSMTLWFWDGYRYYASCILVISVASAITTLV